MGLYNNDQITELRNCDPRALLSLLNAINGSLMIKDDNHKWTFNEVKKLINDMNADRAAMHSEDVLISVSDINLSDSLIEVIRTEVLNNPRIVEDDTVTPTEIGWDDILVSHAAIEPQYTPGSHASAPLVQPTPVNDKPDSGFPLTGEDRIEADPNN